MVSPRGSWREALCQGCNDRVTDPCQRRHLRYGQSRLTRNSFQAVHDGLPPTHRLTASESAPMLAAVHTILTQIAFASSIACRADVKDLHSAFFSITWQPGSFCMSASCPSSGQCKALATLSSFLLLRNAQQRPCWNTVHQTHISWTLRGLCTPCHLSGDAEAEAAPSSLPLRGEVFAETSPAFRRLSLSSAKDPDTGTSGLSRLLHF